MIIGPHCAGWFDPRAWASTVEVQNTITLEVMRVVLATGLFAIGVELPKAYLAEHWKSLVAMVITTMAFGWVICAGELMVIYIHVHIYANTKKLLDSFAFKGLIYSLFPQLFGPGHLGLSYADGFHPCRRYHRREVCYQRCARAYPLTA